MDYAKRAYFEWICDLLGNRSRSYRGLLEYLFNVIFTYTLPLDGNRYEDGIALRYRYGYEKGINDTMIAVDIDNTECSVLEMMVALALRCDEHIMANPNTGERIGEWFFGMIENLGLGFMSDPRFDKSAADFIISRFLNRQYAPDGRGGLFTIPGFDKDLRNAEIWYQAMHYFTYIYFK